MTQTDDYGGDCNCADKEHASDNADSGEGSGQGKEPQSLCAACKQRERDFSECSHSQLCKECRREYIKLKIPVRVKGFLAMVLIVFIASLITLPTTFASFRTYISAKKHMESREYVSALAQYSSLLEEHGESIPIILRTSEAAMSAQHFDTLADIINTYLVGRDLNDADYSQAMAYVDFLESYYSTSDEIYAITERLSANLPERDLSDDELSELYLKFSKELEAMLGKEGFCKSLIYFNLGSVSQDGESALEYLRLAAGQDDRLTYFYPYYGNALRNAGRIDEARQTYLHALSLNAEDAFSIRGLSIIELLEGDKELSLSTMRRAYELEPYGPYIAEAMIIVLHENGLHGEADTLLAQVVSEGFVIEADFQEYLDDKVSVNDYYLG